MEPAVRDIPSRVVDVNEISKVSLGSYDVTWYFLLIAPCTGSSRVFEKYGRSHYTHCDQKCTQIVACDGEFPEKVSLSRNQLIV